MLKLTIGFPVYDDFDGAVFSLQSLRMFHPVEKVEFVVIDNNPTSDHGKYVKGFVEKIKGSCDIKYFEYTDVIGPANAKNKVFDHATGDVVLCMDSHVMLMPGSLHYLREFYDQNPNSMDLVQGPLVYDDLHHYSSHFDDVWRGEMWGIWGTNERAVNAHQPPFEIPAQGMGLFACRKDAWLRFNDKFKAFGGEEYYIHTKYRNAGKKVWCIPGLRWWHRFGRIGGAKFPLTREDKVRNYLIGHHELGLPVENVYKHFVQESGMPALTFKQIDDAVLAEMNVGQQLAPAEDGGTTVAPKKKCGCGSKAVGQGPIITPEQASDLMRSKEDDLSNLLKKHLVPDLNFIEIVDRRTGLHAGILARDAKKIYSCSADTPESMIGSRHTVRQSQVILLNSITDLEKAMERNETIHWGVVNKTGDISPYIHAIKAIGVKNLIVHMSEEALAEYLENDTEWTVIDSWNMFYFLTSSADVKTPVPNLLNRAITFNKAVFKRIWTGAGDAPPEQAKKRYQLCLVCPNRNNDNCGLCGCPVKEKTAWASETCPINKW